MITFLSHVNCDRFVEERSFVVIPQVVHNGYINAELSNYHEKDDESWKNPQNHGVACLRLCILVLDQNFSL